MTNQGGCKKVGYNRQADGRYETNPEEAGIVQGIYHFAAEGKNMQEIIRTVNQQLKKQPEQENNGR